MIDKGFMGIKYLTQKMILMSHTKNMSMKIDEWYNQTDIRFTLKGNGLTLKNAVRKCLFLFF